MTRTIQVAKDFALLPAGRYKKDGSHTGEHFREKLKDLLSQSNESIEVNFDGVLGAGSSFLEEAFAGLIRDGILGKQDFKNKICIIANENPEIAEKVHRYIEEVN
ncbi:STAS-like domain-containing protein [Moraxella nasibovis]|uniref:STAS-like domain-containing protein n=1 Tax=Moraxella nasibovis TaxID=2904120 RepID=UPI00240EED96|nr:STAS-like domain-containing protein [Moraxella nasibovis]WFF38005.1 STAS-like domain-containing protein [Moraxella nasibovis]